MYYICIQNISLVRSNLHNNYYSLHVCFNTTFIMVKTVTGSRDVGLTKSCIKPVLD